MLTRLVAAASLVIVGACTRPPPEDPVVPSIADSPTAREAPLRRCETERTCAERCVDGSPRDCHRLTDLVEQRCAALPSRDSGGIECATAPVAAGQMTEECALGKRHYERERWTEAIDMLRRVVSGDTGDDTGNQELAELALAVSLDRAGRTDEARSRFAAILGRRFHLGYDGARKYVDRGALSR